TNRSDAHSCGAEHLDIVGEFVVVSVTDSGNGMTSAVLAKAFEPFFTTKEAGHGTGLGLSQVYGFMKQSGGHCTIESEPGMGTTVKLYLPRDLKTADAVSEPMERATGLAGNGEQILVVEDDADVRDFAVELLSELGYDVLVAADGAQAL